MSSVLRFDEWQDSDGNTVYDGATGGLIVPGLVAVKDVLKTDTFTASVAAGGNVAVTDLSITHEVSDPANKLIISAFFGVAGNSADHGETSLAVHDGTGLIGIGDAAGSRSTIGSGGFSSEIADRVRATPSVSFVHTPGSGSKTYTVRAINSDTSTRTVYVNRTRGDNDDARYPRGASAIVIQEVAV
jgi:hypothetical protein